MKWANMFFSSAAFISRNLGKIHAPYSDCLIEFSDLEALRMTLLPGDVILTKSNGEFSNLLLKGDYKHAAMYIGGGQIIEAVGSGVRITHIFDLLKHIDYFAVIRSKNHTAAELEVCITELKKCVGYPYDLMFESGNRAFYCSELIVYGLEFARNNLFHYPRTKFLDAQIIYPINLFEDTTHFERVLFSKSEKNR